MARRERAKARGRWVFYWPDSTIWPIRELFNLTVMAGIRWLPASDVPIERRSVRLGQLARAQFICGRWFWRSNGRSAICQLLVGHPGNRCFCDGEWSGPVVGQYTERELAAIKLRSTM